MPLSFSDKQRIEKQFDYFCKKLMKNEKKDIDKHNAYVASNEKLFSNLNIQELNQLYSFDNYEITKEKISILGQEIEIVNNQLYDAIQALSEVKQKIILLSYWLEMTDKEIAQVLNIVRRTVCYLRQSTLKRIKQHMENNKSGTSK